MAWKNTCSCRPQYLARPSIFGVSVVVSIYRSRSTWQELLMRYSTAPVDQRTWQVQIGTDQLARRNGTREVHFVDICLFYYFQGANKRLPGDKDTRSPERYSTTVAEASSRSILLSFCNLSTSAKSEGTNNGSKTTLAVLVLKLQ